MASDAKVYKKLRRHLRDASVWSARRILLTLIALQAATVLAVALYSPVKPPEGTWPQRLWAAARLPMFYPLVMLIVTGPWITLAIWVLHRKLRAWTVASWLVFLWAVSYWQHQHFFAMLKVLWWRTWR